MRPIALLLLFCLALETGCDGSATPSSPGDETNLSSGGSLPPTAHPFCQQEEVIKPLPATEREYINAGFDKYAQIIAPNGKPIKLFAQNDVSAEKLRRAHSLLHFFLTDVPNSKFGTDKSEVANKMADNNAILIMPNGAHNESNELDLPAQPLYDSETPMEGSRWFMDNDWEHRDAAFEEIFHLVHDTGIGTYLPGAIPEYQELLIAEAEQAIIDGRWGIPVEPDVTEWITELRAENSLAQEYIASVIDSYYGLWGPFDERAGGMWGIYIAKTRDEIAAKDAQGLTLLEGFLPPTLNYEIKLAQELNETFSLKRVLSLPYTHKSQYMVHVTLTGTNPANISGNSFDNTLRGNSANNILDGDAGTDTVVYCRPKSEYTISNEGSTIIVSGPDGADTLENIEQIHFADGLVVLGAT